MEPPSQFNIDEYLTIDDDSAGAHQQKQTKPAPHRTSAESLFVKEETNLNDYGLGSNSLDINAESLRANGFPGYSGVPEINITRRASSIAAGAHDMPTIKIEPAFELDGHMNPPSGPLPQLQTSQAPPQQQQPQPGMLNFDEFSYTQADEPGTPSYLSAHGGSSFEESPIGSPHSAYEDAISPVGSFVPSPVPFPAYSDSELDANFQYTPLASSKANQMSSHSHSHSHAGSHGSHSGSLSGSHSGSHTSGSYGSHAATTHPSHVSQVQVPSDPAGPLHALDAFGPSLSVSQDTFPDYADIGATRSGSPGLGLNYNAPAGFGASGNGSGNGGSGAAIGTPDQLSQDHLSPTNQQTTYTFNHNRHRAASDSWVQDSAFNHMLSLPDDNFPSPGSDESAVSAASNYSNHSNHSNHSSYSNRSSYSNHSNYSAHSAHSHHSGRAGASAYNTLSPHDDYGNAYLSPSHQSAHSSAGSSLEASPDGSYGSYGSHSSYGSHHGSHHGSHGGSQGSMYDMQNINTEVHLGPPTHLRTPSQGSARSISPSGGRIAKASAGVSSGSSTATLMPSQNRPRSRSNPYDGGSNSREYFLDLASPNVSRKRPQKHPSSFSCDLCNKKFTRAYNLRSHMRTHTDERPFVCSVCGKAFARQHDRKRHEDLHSGEKKFVCAGTLSDQRTGWGCGRKFARADALGRHFRTEAGKLCIKPLVDDVQAHPNPQGPGPEGISFMATNGQEPQLAMSDRDDDNQSRRAVLFTAVMEQLR